MDDVIAEVGFVGLNRVTIGVDRPLHLEASFDKPMVEASRTRVE